MLQNETINFKVDFRLLSLECLCVCRTLPKKSNERLQTDSVLFYLLPNQITVTFCSIRNTRTKHRV